MLRTSAGIALEGGSASGVSGRTCHFNLFAVFFDAVKTLSLNEMKKQEARSLMAAAQRSASLLGNVAK